MVCKYKAIKLLHFEIKDKLILKPIDYLVCKDIQ